MANPSWIRLWPLGAFLLLVVFAAQTAFAAPTEECVCNMKTINEEKAKVGSSRKKRSLLQVATPADPKWDQTITIDVTLKINVEAEISTKEADLKTWLHTTISKGNQLTSYSEIQNTKIQGNKAYATVALSAPTTLDDVKTCKDLIEAAIGKSPPLVIGTMEINKLEDVKYLMPEYDVKKTMELEIHVTSKIEEADKATKQEEWQKEIKDLFTTAGKPALFKDIIKTRVVGDKTIYAIVELYDEVTYEDYQACVETSKEITKKRKPGDKSIFTAVNKDETDVCSAAGYDPGKTLTVEIKPKEQIISDKFSEEETRIKTEIDKLTKDSPSYAGIQDFAIQIMGEMVYVVLGFMDDMTTEDSDECQKIINDTITGDASPYSVVGLQIETQSDAKCTLKEYDKTETLDLVIDYENVIVEDAIEYTEFEFRRQLDAKFEEKGLPLYSDVEYVKLVQSKDGANKKLYARITLFGIIRDGVMQMDICKTILNEAGRDNPPLVLIGIRAGDPEVISCSLPDYEKIATGTFKIEGLTSKTKEEQKELIEKTQKQFEDAAKAASLEVLSARTARVEGDIVSYDLDFTEAMDPAKLKSLKEEVKKIAELKLEEPIHIGPSSLNDPENVRVYTFYTDPSIQGELAALGTDPGKQKEFITKLKKPLSTVPGFEFAEFVSAKDDTITVRLNIADDAPADTKQKLQDEITNVARTEIYGYKLKNEEPKHEFLTVTASTEASTSTTVTPTASTAAKGGGGATAAASKASSGSTVSGASSASTASGASGGSTASGASGASSASRASGGSTVSGASSGSTVSGATGGSTASGASSGSTTSGAGGGTEATTKADKSVKIPDTTYDGLKKKADGTITMDKCQCKVECSVEMEYKITGFTYDNDLADTTSTKFKTTSEQFEKMIDPLMEKNTDFGPYFIRSYVTKITKESQVFADIQISEGSKACSEVQKSLGEYVKKEAEDGEFAGQQVEKDAFKFKEGNTYDSVNSGGMADVTTEMISTTKHITYDEHNYFHTVTIPCVVGILVLVLLIMLCMGANSCCCKIFAAEGDASKPLI